MDSNPNNHYSAPPLIRFVLKVTGIDDEKKAAYILLAVAIVLFGISFLIVSYGMSLITTKYPTAEDTLRAIEKNHQQAITPTE